MGKASPEHFSRKNMRAEKEDKGAESSGTSTAKGQEEERSLDHLMVLIVCEHLCACICGHFR